MGDARGLLRIVHCIGGWPDGRQRIKKIDPDENKDENEIERTSATDQAEFQLDGQGCLESVEK